MAAPPLPELRDSVRKMPKRTKRTGSQPTVNSTGIKLGIVATGDSDSLQGPSKKARSANDGPDGAAPGRNLRPPPIKRLTNPGLVQRMLDRLLASHPNHQVKNPEGKGGCLFFAGAESALDVDLTSSTIVTASTDRGPQTSPPPAERALELAARVSIWNLLQLDEEEFGRLFASRRSANEATSLVIETVKSDLKEVQDGNKCILSVRIRLTRALHAQTRM